MDEEKQDKKFFQKSDALKFAIIALASFIVLILTFGAGVKIGALKAGYSYRWAENYHKNFGGPRSGFFGDWRKFPEGDFIGGHGAFGEIIELNDTGFVIRGREDIEKAVMVTDETLIKKGRETVMDGLAVGDYVTIIGAPNAEGQIEAKLIRVFNIDAGKPQTRRSRPVPFF